METIRERLEILIDVAGVALKNENENDWICGDDIIKKKMEN